MGVFNRGEGLGSTPNTRTSGDFSPRRRVGSVNGKLLRGNFRDSRILVRPT